MNDPYLYEGTNTLINKLGYKDQEKLQIAEDVLTSNRLFELNKLEKPIGNFDEKHLRMIHKYIFQDVYEWAGQFRQIDMSKGGGPPFAPRSMFRFNFLNFEEKMRSKTKQDFLTKQDFAKAYASTLNDLNFIHPFREGNGRTQREFFRQLAKHHGFELSFKNEKVQELYMRGTIQDNEKLTEKALIEGIENTKSKLHNKNKKNHLER